MKSSGPSASSTFVSTLTLVAHCAWRKEAKGIGIGIGRGIGRMTGYGTSTVTGGACPRGGGKFKGGGIRGRSWCIGIPGLGMKPNRDGNMGRCSFM